MHLTRTIMAASKQVDTIIVGAGWSGAVAAKELTAKGRSVLVLEARDRVGGRARTWTDDQVKVDLGCSWIHGYKEGNPARAIAESLKVTAHLPNAAEGVIYGPDGPLSAEVAASLRSSLSAAQGASRLPHPAPPSSASLASALLAADSPLFASNASPKPSADVNQTNPADPTLAATSSSSASSHKDLAAGLARSLEVPLGLKLEKASLRWAGWESTTSFAGSDAAPEGGYESLVGKVLEEAKSSGAEVKLGTTVAKVQKQDEGVTIIDEAGTKYSAKSTIVTIPLGVLKTFPTSAFEPALPKQLQETIAGTHVGVLEKLLLRYPAAWWPNADKVGSYTFLPTSTKPLTDSSSLSEVFAASTIITANFAGPSLPNASPTLLSYLSETPATAALKHNPEDVTQAFHEFLVSRLKPSNAPHKPSGSALTDWLTDPLSRGATTTPSIISENGERSPMDFKELGRPIWDGRLGFAGEHTEMENRGSVAGAVLSGYREAERVNRLLNLVSA